MNRVIAIDGPSGAGKSTIAKAVGRVLGFLHVDSGALYRIVAWQLLQAGGDPEDEESVSAFAEKLKIETRVEDGAVNFFVNGDTPGEAIRSATVNSAVSPVSKVASVRTQITDWLRQMRELGDLVVEGRDIGSVVFSDSPARFYLDADPAERARRRHLEEQAKGMDSDRQAVLESLANRDRIDSSRSLAPLKIADGAIKIDSTHLGIDQVVELVLANLPDGWR